MMPIRVPKSASGWDWDGFVGDPHALKFAKRELVNLHAAIKRVKTRRVAVQAGGNQGLWPKYLAQWFASVITFEPDAENFARMQQNAPETNITRYRAALGEAPASVGLGRDRRDGSRGAFHSGIVHVHGDGDVPMMRLDDLQLPVCDLIYLDIEGYELFALRGAVETIARCRPVIAVEVNQNLRFFGLTPDDMSAFFFEQGYQYVTTLAKNDRVYVPRAA